jgi:transcription antitermination factor NusG
MRSLQHLVSSGQGAAPWPYIEMGSNVRLHAGPLAGIEGIVLASKGKQRLIISVTLLRRSIAIEVDPRWVTPVAARVVA